MAADPSPACRTLTPNPNPKPLHNFLRWKLRLPMYNVVCRFSGPARSKRTLTGSQILTLKCSELTMAKAYAYNSYIATRDAYTAAAAALLCLRQSGRTAYRLRSPSPLRRTLTRYQTAAAVAACAALWLLFALCCAFSFVAFVFAVVLLANNRCMYKCYMPLPYLFPAAKKSDLLELYIYMCALSVRGSCCDVPYATVAHARHV